MEARLFNPRKEAFNQRRAGEMEELIDSIENISALGESIAVLAVAPEHLAGELSPHSLQRMATMIMILCDQVIEKINQATSTQAKDDRGEGGFRIRY